MGNSYLPCNCSQVVAGLPNSQDTPEHSTPPDCLWCCLWHMMSSPIWTFILRFKIFPMFLVLFSDHNAPFAQWSTERVCNWLEDFGLGQYVIFARQWVTSGHTLLTATPQDMEKVITASLYLLILSNHATPNHWFHLSEIHGTNFHS